MPLGSLRISFRIQCSAWSTSASQILSKVSMPRRFTSAPRRCSAVFSEPIIAWKSPQVVFGVR